MKIDKRQQSSMPVSCIISHAWVTLSNTIILQSFRHMVTKSELINYK